MEAVYMVIAIDGQGRPRGVYKAAGERFFGTPEQGEEYLVSMGEVYAKSFRVCQVLIYSIELLEDVPGDGATYKPADTEYSV